MSEQRPLNWFKVSIHHPPVAGEAVSAVLFEEGASGVWEDQPDEQGRQVTRAGFHQEAAAYLENRLPEIMDRLVNIFESEPDDFVLFMELEKNHDWAEKWKEGLRPIAVGPHLTVAPTWWPEDDLPRDRALLRIDPGLAFGSGHHASTYMCLSLLCDCAPDARRILDVGSGSGILALAAAALSPAASITGVDNDPQTLPVAEKNALDNHLAGRIQFSDCELSSLTPGFDLIAANITLGPLKALAPDIAGLAAEGGRLILSGLLESQVEEIVETYTARGWRIERRLDQDEWSALSLIKGETARPAREEA